MSVRIQKGGNSKWVIGTNATPFIDMRDANMTALPLPPSPTPAAEESQ